MNEARWEFEGDERPWERPGGRRRDSEPHRGPLLVLLGTASLVCGILSLCLAAAAVIGLPLAVCTCVLVQGDLARMEAGRMDRCGQQPAERAQDRAVLGGLLCLCGLAFWGVVLVLPFPALPWRP
jgi:hypothetical protein